MSIELITTCTRVLQAQYERGIEIVNQKTMAGYRIQDVGMDCELNFMYTCSFHEDDYEMEKIDKPYQNTGLVV